MAHVRLNVRRKRMSPYPRCDCWWLDTSPTLLTVETTLGKSPLTDMARKFQSLSDSLSWPSGWKSSGHWKLFFGSTLFLSDTSRRQYEKATRWTVLFFQFINKLPPPPFNWVKVSSAYFSSRQSHWHFFSQLAFIFTVHSDDFPTSGQMRNIGKQLIQT